MRSVTFPRSLVKDTPTYVPFEPYADPWCLVSWSNPIPRFIYPVTPASESKRSGGYFQTRKCRIYTIGGYASKTVLHNNASP